MTKNFIKGKILETIFQEMFCEEGEFTVIPLGYEHTTPLLAQYQEYLEVKQVLENIRSTPDFALVSHNEKKVFLVEAKYRNIFTNEDILQIAQSNIERWKFCYLFVASKDGFYFSSYTNIIKSNGEIKSLDDNWIKMDIQNKYLTLLKEFVQGT